MLTFKSTVPSFVKCLESLPNLHTLEIPFADERITDQLANALKLIKLPQIKTLIIPPATHPLLRHCHGVEDLVCVVRYARPSTPSDGILSSLASNRDSKVKRLAIPLVSWANPSRKRFGALGSLDVGGGLLSPTLGFVTACPKLTELTIISPHPDTIEDLETGYFHDPVGIVRFATSELVNACKLLPDFDTLRIVHGCGLDYGGEELHVKQLQREYMEHVNAARDMAISCLKGTGMGHREGEGRRKTTVRVVELVAGPAQNFYMESVRVEEYEV
jgi:hypothetical protein